MSMKYTLCPSFLSKEIKVPRPNGGLFSPTKNGHFIGAADVVNSIFIALMRFYCVLFRHTVTDLKSGLIVINLHLIVTLCLYTAVFNFTLQFLCNNNKS